ncbi:hypothetical protein [Methyloterricola oryzae]|uniref:hypothetical protein n=1 Tax=Methyloterricola oryzae TaxID=1495050 RepID=UPI0005EB5D58|nr:hypothetical protein [Methyloterricola oryzae]
MLAGLCLLANCGLASSAPKSQDAATQQVLRKAQGMLRQLSQEKAILEAEKAALAEQVKKLEATVRELEPLKSELARHRTAADSLRDANGALELRLARAQQQEASLLQRQKEIVGKAKLIQADNTLLLKAVEEREAWIGKCGDQNRGLVAAGREVVEKYRDKGFWDQLAESEPFTGIAKVQTENISQSYRYKIDQLQMTPFDARTEKGKPTEQEKGDTEGDDGDE